LALQVPASNTEHQCCGSVTFWVRIRIRTTDLMIRSLLYSLWLKRCQQKTFLFFIF
jgi:hypothetical protein